MTYEGKLVFIKDSYYDEFNSMANYRLEVNKGTTMRPCLCVFRDVANSNIFWCVPASSKIDKYKNWLEKYPNLSNRFYFTKINKRNTCLLLQNIFPVCSEHIDRLYVDRYKKTPIQISSKALAQVAHLARRTLLLSLQGRPMNRVNTLGIYSHLNESHPDTEKRDSSYFQYHEKEAKALEQNAYRSPYFENPEAAVSTPKRRSYRSRLQSALQKKDTTLDDHKAIRKKEIKQI